jgi:membrane protein YqaA with SNARE-associated domain
MRRRRKEIDVKGFIKAIGLVIASSAILFFSATAGTAVGAIAGWCVGLFFDDTLWAAQRALHIGYPEGDGWRALAPWQLGAALGFLSGFVRTSVTKAS